MSQTDFIEKNAISQGTYYLLSREHVDALYDQAGFDEDAEEVPNYLTVGDKEILFTENFVERDGEEYEIVIIANEFKWSDVLVFDEHE